MATVKGSTDVKKKPTTTITIPGTGGVKVQTVAPKPTTKAPTAPVPAVKTAAPTTKPVSGVNGERCFWYARMVSTGCNGNRRYWYYLFYRVPDSGY